MKTLSRSDCPASERQTRRETWRFLDLEFKNPYMNMAVEEAIVKNVGQARVANTVRFWRNLETVVVGAYQDAEAETNLQLCQEQGVSVVRRFTGGGAVYHDLGNLNFSIALRQSHRLVTNDLLKTFEILSQGAVLGLKALGINNVQCEQGNCIVVNGFKLAGIAGCVRWGAFFCHGSTLVSTDPNRIDSFLTSKMPRHDKYVKSVRRPVTTVSQQLNRTVMISEVKAAFQEGFEKAFDVVLVPGGLFLEENKLADELYEEKYGTREWNLERP